MNEKERSYKELENLGHKERNMPPPGLLVKYLWAMVHRLLERGSGY
jgi:hypothetical protein